MTLWWRKKRIRDSTGMASWDGRLGMRLNESIAPGLRSQIATSKNTHADICVAGEFWGPCHRSTSGALAPTFCKLRDAYFGVGSENFAQGFTDFAHCRI